MFPGPLSGDFSLAAARLRAAENAVPVIRGNILGPSAFIRADGTAESELSYGQQGVLRGTVSLTPHAATPYTNTGSWPVFVLATVIVGIALATRRTSV
jgi:apolipoprotein N-acyltransferase